MNPSEVPDSAIEPELVDASRSPVETAENLKRAPDLSRITAALLRGIPTAIVLALLGGVAYLGHNYGWNLPKFSELMSTKENNEVLWCDEHCVPEAECIACNSELMPKGELFGWCREHGVHECVLHHPQLAQLQETPQVNVDDFKQAQRAIDVRPRTKNDPGCKMHLRRIQFSSIDSVNKAGIDIGLVDREAIVETIKVTGEVVYDPTRVAQMSSRTTGTIWRVEKNIGDRVSQGEVLAFVDAVEVGRIKSNLLEKLVELDLATKTRDRLKRLGGNVISTKEIQEAETAKAALDVAVANAAQMLSNLGLPIQTTDYLGPSIDTVRTRLHVLGLPERVRDSLGSSTNLLPVFASRDGIIVMRDTFAGEVVEAGKPLFTIVDTSQMWLLLDVRLEEADRISVGQKVIFRHDGSERVTTGTISWMSTEVDSETRTVQVRGELDNQHGTLRNETFGSGEIVLREEKNAAIVPEEAIHWEGCCHVAFVRDKNYFEEGSYKVFHTRSVRPGATVDGKTEVIAGLLPGEVVVTKGGGILRAELLKGNLGAG